MHKNIQGYVAAVLRPDGSNDVPVGEIVLVVCEQAADVAKFAHFKPRCVCVCVYENERERERERESERERDVALDT